MKLPDGVWECVACKGLNPPSTLRCNACGIPRFGWDEADTAEELERLGCSPLPACAFEGGKKLKSIVKKTRRKPAERMNKSEAAVYQMLIEKYTGALVLPQALTLPFPDGTSYRPDFMVFGFCGGNDRKIIIVEVKGGYRGMGYEGGMERYRRARDQYKAWFEFQMWTKKGGKWEVS